MIPRARLKSHQFHYRKNSHCLIFRTNGMTTPGDLHPHYRIGTSRGPAIEAQKKKSIHITIIPISLALKMKSFHSNRWHPHLVWRYYQQTMLVIWMQKVYMRVCSWLPKRLSFFIIFFLIHFSMDWLVWPAQSPWPQAHSSSSGWTGTATVSQVLSLDISHQPQLRLQDSKSLQPVKVWKKAFPRHSCCLQGRNAKPSVQTQIHVSHTVLAAIYCIAV